MNKKTVLLVGALIIATPFIKPVTIPAKTPATAPATTPEITGKKITCTQINVLNSQLTQFPMGTIRMRLATKKIREVLKNTESKKNSFGHNHQTEKTFVHEQLALIIKPVQEFFDILQDPMILTMVKPIIADALDNPKKSYILDFCNSKKSILSFCETEVATCATLENISKELLQFFGSVNLSLSDKAKDAAKQLEDQLKQQQADKKKAEKK